MIGVRKIDTVSYEEGDIFTVTTNDSSAILILCGGNASLLGGRNYIATDSTIINGKQSISGIDNKTKLNWRRYLNMAYVGVKDRDTLRYNQLLYRAIKK